MKHKFFFSIVLGLLVSAAVPPAQFAEAGKEGKVPVTTVIEAEVRGDSACGELRP